MLRLKLTCLTATLLAGLSTASAVEMDNSEEQWAMLEEYCVDCHNFEDYAGGLAFDVLQRDQIQQDAEVWETVIRKLRGRMMPPPGETRPEPGQIQQFASNLEHTLDAVAVAELNPGSPLLHRLNRAEYANAIRDLLGLPFDTSVVLPADDSSDGFDNIANVLSISPALMQAYISTAAKVSRLAIGDPTISPGISTYRPTAGVSQSYHLEGLPLGTRGGISAEHVFPLDAQYQINIARFGRNPFALAAVGNEEAIEIVIDGERVMLIPAGSSNNVTIPVAAGPRKIEISFVHTQSAQDVDDLYAVHADSVRIGSFSITGPLDAFSAGTTPSRQRIFICRPELASEEAACAQQILSQLASRAYRRPVNEESMDILMAFYEDGRELRGFETGIQYALTRILVDPQFIFRFEAEPVDLAEGENYQVDDFELASRLSFFIWSSIPDDELLTLANNGELSNPDTLRQQVTRMLKDSKSISLVENFARQWLSLNLLESANPISSDFDGSLKQSMRKETEMLFASILNEDRSIVDLLDADYTFVDERLAKHYNIPNIRGSRFRRVKIDNDARRGLLGHGSILTLTSAPNRTSPVKRGQWVMENLLGTPPPPPPPGVETNLEEAIVDGVAPSSIRQRLERHQADPNCSSCHSMIDPIGFSLENFDSVGMWRDASNGEKIDTHAEFWDGTALDGPVDLRNILLSMQDRFVSTATEKLMTYALGRKVEYYDMHSIRAIIEESESNNYKFSDLVNGIVASPAFQMRRKEDLSEDQSETLVTR